MLLRNSIFALAALAALAGALLVPTNASARGYHNNGHHIIVVCRKAGGEQE